MSTPLFIETEGLFINLAEIESVSKHLYAKNDTVPIFGQITVTMHSGQVHMIYNKEDSEKILKTLDYYKIKDIQTSKELKESLRLFIK
jgi:hypothetical protein